METQKEGSLSKSDGDKPAVSDQSLNPPSSGGSKIDTVNFFQPRAIRKDKVFPPSDILQSDEYTLVRQHLPVPRLFIYYNEFKMECDPKAPKMLFTHGVAKKESPHYHRGLDVKKNGKIIRGGQSFENYTSLMVAILADEITSVLNGSCFCSKSSHGRKEEGDQEELIFEMEDLDI